MVKFFVKNKGVVRHGRGGSADLVNYFYKQDDIRKAIASLTLKDGELLNLVYEQKMYVGTELVDRVRWKLDEIQTEVKKLLIGLNNSECLRLFGDKEAVKGSDDGRLVGLSELIFNANEKAYEMSKNIKFLDEIMKNGKDPMEYAYIGATKATRRIRVR